MYPAIFLDRDGVLIENRSDYVRDWSQVRIFPEAIHALSRSAIKNYKIVIVTNQSAVGRGLISLEIANEINARLVNFIHRICALTNQTMIVIAASRSPDCCSERQKNCHWICNAPG
jgi:histidinol-phosphate phosphatase family protein